jgi:hypothetical protein
MVPVPGEGSRIVGGVGGIRMVGVSRTFYGKSNTLP